MKFRGLFLSLATIRGLAPLATLFVLVLTAAALATPRPLNAQSDGAPRNQSVSGKISAVGDAQFTVSVSNAKDQRGPQNVEFLVDDKTRVEGKLAVGAQALVEYRSDSGRNIAVHIVVTPASGSHMNEVE